MKIFFSLLFFFLSCLSLDGASLFLVNDSPYTLTAVVHGADGRTLGTVTLNPGEQNGWSATYDRTNLDEVYNASSSLTPFSVVWECAYQGYYSVCTGVAPGASVTATGCNGALTCEPKPKKQECIPCCPPEKTENQ